LQGAVRCGGGTVADVIADPVAERDYEQVLYRIELGEVRELADELDERARSVLRAHYGLGQPPTTLNEIGAGLGVTAERARQIEADALRQLRDRLGRTPVARAAGRSSRGPAGRPPPGRRSAPARGTGSAWGTRRGRRRPA